ncbi:SRR1-like protein [Parasteatoda tepidariorum]|uniref:SRR1-like protein n=1 Tax=Parasteatoda tepidariorum TaxID=114398 RepID=UPI001C727F3D|nr:SRR1-like protein [Parasteatoda tepidariorum]XP_042904888.1 SRR1-like protein [Parasteatoda tepidariorum]XP_042904889.1 SRR1-like protein [Parasteatoda tepidariorum]XP_042904890.1 SRR1-like protein [Parasteatoda tepidariorum]XP_042904891.1 SRR1-like protein [Parasteatoda tepidariorum]
MNLSDSDGFKFVSYKKGRKGRTSVVASHGKRVDSKCMSSNLESSRHFIKLDQERITSLQFDLEKSEFFNDLKKSLSSIFTKQTLKTKGSDLSESISAISLSEAGKEPTDIVCYGLGAFSSCMIARYQLAFLLALKSYLEIKAVSLYDPIFSCDEKDCLIKLGLDVLSVNEKAKRSVSQRTIFFMPHCDLPLYNNLLWSNWNVKQMVNIIIIGNSFSNYKRLPNAQLEKRGGYINRANEFVTELKMSNNYVFKDVFNDMSIHYFKEESLSKVPAKTWLDVSEPVYELDDLINYS